MNNKTHNKRMIVMICLFMAVIAMFIYQITIVQVANGEYYKNEATAVRVVKQYVPAVRGEIVDRYGRPFTTNRVSYDVILDRAYLPYGKENETILKVINILEAKGVKWFDNLPISMSYPFEFTEDSDSAIRKLKRELSINEYATAEECMYWLCNPKFYNINKGKDEKGEVIPYSPEDARKIAGVRYEMVQKAFSLENIYVLAADVGEDLRNIILERSFDLKGVTIMESPVREYVDGTLAPHILGITGPMYKEDMDSLKEEGKWWSKENPHGYRTNDSLGKSGLEYTFEDELRGKSGEKTLVIDVHGNVVDASINIPPVPGNTVVTTLDRDLQKAAQDALAEVIEGYQAKKDTLSHDNGRDSIAGAVVVEDPKTGEILAMANYPNYNINNYLEDYAELSKQKPEPLLNRCTMGLYRPGSTYKPVVATGGLQEGVITPTETIFCGHIYGRFPDYPAQCMHYDGDINVVRALQRSCNIFFYETGWRLGIDRQNEYASYYGLGQKTGIEINELAGHLSTPEYHESLGEEWGNGNVIQSAIGQLDHAFTPVQMAGYVSTIANKGTRMQSHLVKSIRSYSFKDIVKETPLTVAQELPVKKEYFDVIEEGMIKATQPGGTSWWLWQGFPYTVASKTGSPQATQDLLNSAYICYMPAEDPQLAIFVMIELGGQGYTGAPVARKIAESYFNTSASFDRVQDSNVILE